MQSVQHVQCQSRDQPFKDRVGAWKSFWGPDNFLGCLAETDDFVPHLQKERKVFQCKLLAEYFFIVILFLGSRYQGQIF